jgi:hypothetical protein
MRPSLPWTSPGVAALGYVVVATFFGYGVWYRLMSRHPASTVAPFTLLVPVVGMGTAWLVRGEHPTWGELLGCLIVLVGLALVLGLVDALGLQRRAAPMWRTGMTEHWITAKSEGVPCRALYRSLVDARRKGWAGYSHGCSAFGGPACRGP